MSFMNSMENTLNEEFNRSRTENGALGYRTTGKELLDLNFKVSSLRKADEYSIIKDFERAFAEDKKYAIKWLFYLRDVREGLGERRSFKVILKHIANVEPELCKAFIALVPEYGRYDDWFELLGTECESDVLKMIADQLEKDFAGMKNKKPISLLSKWMPSTNASSVATRKKAATIRNYLGYSEKKYRKKLSKLREYIDVVERKMSSKNWEEINYETVPSKANLLYNKAFMKNDEERRKKYLESLQRGEVKINSSTNFPHEIVHKYGRSGSVDTTLEELWKALPNMVEDDANTLFVRDGSYSMTCRVDTNSSVTALEVATALAIYFSERAAGEFKDKFITFSSRPQLIKLGNCSTLAEKIRRCYSETDCSNTNIKATFDLILRTAIENKMKQEDMPKNILVVSDMEFDGATYDHPNQTLFQKIEKEYKDAGYQLPRLVFWNVNSRTGTIPVKENSLGVALVSGFSVNIVKMVLSGQLDPYKCLIEQLDTERYEAVEAAIRDLV